MDELDGAKQFDPEVVDPRPHPYALTDHLSHFTGIVVAQLYILVAAVTIGEVLLRYIFNAPTSWAFEIVTVTSATAWMLSAGYITMRHRHISITLIFDMVPPKARWWLELWALVIGVLALYLLFSDSLQRAMHSVEVLERSGTRFNSPLPMVLRSVLAAGAGLYLLQLLRNLSLHFENTGPRIAVRILGAVIALSILVTVLADLLGPVGVVGVLQDGFSGIGSVFDPSAYVDLRAYDIGAICLITVAVLIALMGTGMPLGIVTLVVSLLFALCYFGPRGLYLVSTNAYGMLENYSLVAVPMFVLMASLLERAGVAKDLFNAMSIFAGNLRGGVAIQTVVVSVIIAAMSGVIGGEIVMLGLVALPQMFRLGYDRRLTIGLICASGALATLIPPSIIMIIYGLSAEVSIGSLFMAGATPGIMLAVAYAGYVLIRCQLNPSLAPTAREAEEISGETITLGRASYTAVAMSVALVFAVMGAIYLGIASVTEAAAIGVGGAILVALVRNHMNWKILQESLMGTMVTVGTIVWLILGAVSFVGIFNLIGGSQYLREMILGIGLPPLGIILVMMGILMVLGTFLEWIAIAFITVPVFAPVVTTLAPELGMEPSWAAIWFGVLFVMNIQIYFLSPPFGPACFWLKSVAPPDVTLQEIFRGVIPFIFIQIAGLALVMLFPEIALWLPKALSN
ncbi:MAG: C4-dicarboxylate ABC transporter permease [Fulvimarina sp.]|nr:C4-dicarboxylate ABC transporter permease [Fulvimarina sp.]